VYFDDILLYSHNRFDHSDHIRQVFQVLRDSKLRYVVSKNGVEVDASKIEAIQIGPLQ
jgi:hypothetical protein